MINGPVLVLGASGRVGGAVLRSLCAGGHSVRGAARNPDLLSRRYPRIDVVRLDLTDPTSFAPALHGVAGLFLVRPPDMTRVGSTINALIDEAANVGLGHVVFSSVLGADTARMLPHHRVETRLMRSGLTWTILRPGFFAQNLESAYRRDIVRTGAIVLPAGTARVAFLDVRDLGDAAATVFADPGRHRNRGYPLTGPEALDFEQVAQLLTRELGRPIRYRPTSVGGYLAHLIRQRTPPMQAAVQTVVHARLATGAAEGVDLTLPRLLGRPAGTISEYVRQCSSCWDVPVT